MKKYFLIILPFICSNVFGQNVPIDKLITLSKTIQAINHFNNSLERSSFLDDSTKFIIHPRFVAIGPFYFYNRIDSFEKEDYNKWLEAIRSVENQIIDSSLLSASTLDGQLVGVLFVSGLYKNYFIVEAYYTRKYRGYECSDVLLNRRIQFLFQLVAQELRLIDYRLGEQGNECRFLD